MIASEDPQWRARAPRSGTLPTRWVRTAAIAALSALPLVSAACHSPPATVPVQVRLTPQGAPYRVVTFDQVVLTYASRDTGPNDREVTWRSAPVRATTTECATWLFGQGAAQNGLAFDIHAGRRRTTAIVLERNVWLAGYWDFVAIDFDSAVPNGFTPVPDSSVDLSSYLGRTAVPTYPLRVCARIVGTSLQFEVQRGAEAGTSDPPPFGTPSQGGTISLAGLADATAGMTGVYEAHLPPGTVSVVADVTLDGLPYTP